jgi:hypothetical protein
MIITIYALARYYHITDYISNVNEYKKDSSQISKSKNAISATVKTDKNDQPLSGLPLEKGNEKSGTDITVTHMETPDAVHGIYVSSYGAGSEKIMKRVYELIDNYHINAVVIDVKDATGKLSYIPIDPELVSIGVGEKRIIDIKQLIDTLHKKHVYVIGRVQTFEDPFLAKTKPELSLKKEGTDTNWTDQKGIGWVRANSTEVYDYNIRIALDAHSQGFDEINFDYVRFPTDGAVNAVDLSSFKKSKAETIEDFFKYLDQNLRSKGVKISADVFGLTVSVKGDMGIGQEINRVAPHVDYISPMIYPSHFGKGNYGYENPAKYPYEVILRALNDGVEKISRSMTPGSATSTIATSTKSEVKTKMRPWLQVFSIGGVTYDAAKVTLQIKAASDAGVNSWLLWDPKNTYLEYSN